MLMKEGKRIHELYMTGLLPVVQGKGKNFVTLRNVKELYIKSAI